ncbi:MAG: hypothetical protein HN356_02620 [Calditrichaeota bacterium]|jgi:hypothetical protein|nr:hypothetical protein [Calditrichota bacterium]MBT7788586.1 hypothetical protein [Calditrichota bacterium]
MSNEAIEQQLTDIQSKLDNLVEEIEEHRRHRLEMDELKADLTVIAKDVFATTVKELEDVAPFVNTGDFLDLMKRLLRNTRTITDVVGKTESSLDFVEDAFPIGKEMFHDLMLKLDEFDRKGYFGLLQSFGSTLDQVVEKISPEELNKITDQVVIPIIELTSKLADLNLLPALSRAVDEFNNQSIDAFDNFSSWKAYKKSRKTEMRRAMGRTLHFLEAFSRETNNRVAR